ncbi:hypothetical protein [Geothrix sp. 21YS21S-2]|uniref:hypothetical protein n=1 Tax=Geothrix sp. 21YS21S-2 TaxID=3068893 RepID=UPI0027B9EEAA|nr:hypothetical protein [Geothrix sp. 21YS21S-2]
MTIQRVGRLTAGHGTALLAMSARFVAAGGWLVAMAMVVANLSPAQQGFHYAFQSLIALQILMEMGMSTVILTTAGHEVALLAWSGEFWRGEDFHIQRLGSLMRLAMKWYGIAGLAVVFIIVPFGVVFFSRTHPADTGVVWLGPWIGLGLATAASVFMVGMNAMAEGMGAVRELALTRLFQSTVAIVSFSLALKLGAGLWSASVMVGSGVVVNASLLYLKCGPRMVNALHSPVGARIDWAKDLLPFQWRIAVSWMAGYAIFQLLTPTVFAFNGAVAAGRFGMAVQATTGVGAIAGAWLQVRQAPWAQGAARRDWTFLDSDFRKVGTVTTTLAILGCGCLVLIFHFAGRVGYGTRVPSGSVLLPLCIAICLNQWTNAMATYLRSFRVEPFLIPSLLMAASIAIGCTLLRHQEPFVLAWWYCAMTILVGLTGGGWVFHRWRRLNQA